MSNSIKQLRGQVRQIVKELLSEVLNDELVQALRKDIYTRLDAIDKHVKSTTQEMNDRTKETQSYVVRNLTLASTVVDSNKLENNTK